MPEKKETEEQRYESVVSAQTGKALIFDHERKPLYIMERYVHYLSAVTGLNLPSLMDPQIKDWLPCYDMTLAELRARLELDAKFIDAFSLVMVVLDPDDEDCRKNAVKPLSDLLKCGEVLELLQNVLFANWFDDEADFEGALRLSDDRALSMLLTEVLDNREAIAWTCKNWNDLPDHFFGEIRPILRSLAGREGLFRAVALGRSREDLNAILEKRDLRHYPMLRAILHVWLDPDSIGRH